MNEIDELLNIMSMLRDPQSGCPWDREQTIESILPYTMEEVHELADTVERMSMDEMCDELGDLLFHVVFYAQLAAESGEFDFRAVTQRIISKLRGRHPHVFADKVFNTPDEQRKSWEELKSEERMEKGTARYQDQGLLEGISETLSEVARSLKLQRRAANVGFDWREAGEVYNKIVEELAELHIEIKSDASRNRITEELGDLLFSCINLARHLGIDPERALRKSNMKFVSRFAYIDKRLREQNRSFQDSTIEEMDNFWQEAKNKQDQ